MQTLKVSTKSNPNSVAGALAGIINEGEREIEFRLVGAGALNQAVKATAIARGFLKEKNIDIALEPAFGNINIEGNERTAIRLRILFL